MAELIAKRYANALFEVALEEKRVEKYKDELTLINDCFREYSQLMELMNSPLIQLNEKKDIMKECFNGKVSQEILNFIYILLDKRRQGFLPNITLEYNTLADKSKNMISATAITATAMKKEDLMKLQMKLSMSSGKNIHLSNKVDKDIIGGILIRMGDKVIDGSIKSRLLQLKEELSEIIV